MAGTQAVRYVPVGYDTFQYGSLWGIPSDAVDTNGAYNVGPAYDMVTGLGIANIAQIAAELEAPSIVPPVQVSAQLPSAPIPNGSTPVTLEVATIDSSSQYQWYLNGVPIAGAAGSSLVVSPTAANQGEYTVVATNPSGSTSASAGTLTVATDAWLSNLSARANVGTDANMLIAGFVTSGNSNKPLLIRGVGPSLQGFGVSGYLPDPMLTLINTGATPMATATSWAPSLAQTFDNVGAFPLVSGSHDDALLESVAPGAYTVQVGSQSSNTGVALAEIYSADTGTPMSRLINLSARAVIGAGTNSLIGGFMIAGTTAQTVVIRGDGPVLSSMGLSGAISNPVLTLAASDGSVIATNAGWSSGPAAGNGKTSSITVQPLTSAITAKIGAFALADGSKDSAIVATLPPGVYTAQVTGATQAAGISLLEIYELR